MKTTHFFFCSLTALLILSAWCGPLTGVTHADTQPKIVRISAADMERKVVTRVPPEYPSAAATGHIEGIVKLEIIVGTDGAPRQLKVLHGHPILTQAAIKAVGKWRYEPTTLAGEPVEVLTTVNVVFHLE